MFCVHTDPGFASGDRTFRAKRAVPAERDTVAAWNVVYQDFIHHSIRTLAWFLPEATDFSGMSSENLPEVYSLLITRRNFGRIRFPFFNNSPYTGRLRIDWLRLVPVECLWRNHDATNYVTFSAPHIRYLYNARELVWLFEARVALCHGSLTARSSTSPSLIRFLQRHTNVHVYTLTMTSRNCGMLIIDFPAFWLDAPDFWVQGTSRWC